MLTPWRNSVTSTRISQPKFYGSPQIQKVFNIGPNNDMNKRRLSAGTPKPPSCESVECFNGVSVDFDRDIIRTITVVV